MTSDDPMLVEPSVERSETEAYEELGYIIIDTGLSAETLNQVIEEVASRYSNAPDADDCWPPGTRVQDSWQDCEPVRAIATMPSILSLLERLYGRRPLPFQTLNFPVGTEQNPHADSFHFTSRPEGFMCGVWLALEDVDEHNGPLVVFPGSHRLAEASAEDVRQQMGGSAHELYESYVAEELERHGFESHPVMIKAGQAIVWQAGLVHGGSPQLDARRTRHSLVTHYFFEGCRYITPLSGYGPIDYERNPAWVTAHPPTLASRAQRAVRGLHPRIVLTHSALRLIRLVKRLRGDVPAHDHDH